jgi:hypothetical protein
MDGDDNTGGGGGGAHGQSYNASLNYGGTGGSGIVVVKFPAG